MKKTYVNPQIKVMKIEVTRMLAASTFLGVSGTNYDGNTSVESPSFSTVWDDVE